MKKLISLVCTVCLLFLVLPVNVFAETGFVGIVVSEVTINKTSDILTVGETDTLEANITPADATNKSVIWISSNTQTVSVDSKGVITAISAGTAQIIVTTVDGNKAAVCNVIVKDPQVAGVTLNKTSVNLAIGETDTLTAGVSPDSAANKSVSWISSNPDIASVDNFGKITAVSAGSAVVTVTTEDGNKTAYCNVTVYNQPVTGITLNKASEVLIIGETDILTAVISPVNASNKSVKWTSSNSDIATVDVNGKITAVNAGTAFISVTTIDGNKKAACSITVKPISVSYQGHVQNIGWQNLKINGQAAGTIGRSLRLEALKINLNDAPVGSAIKYQMHVQNIGWQNIVSNGMEAGTNGQALRTEAIKVWLENLPGYSIQYRVHVQNIGWMPWTENGCIAGTEGQSLRIEAIEIRLVKTINLEYQVHVQNVGWKDPVSNGTITGTSGQPLRIEALNVRLLNAPEGSYLTYQAHVQNLGWQDWKSEGINAGTTGKSLRVEALRIKLVNMPGYSIQYQVFIQNFGWQSWVDDGQEAGTNGKGLRIEGIRIRIIENPDGSATPEAVQPTVSMMKTTSYRFASYLDSNENIASVQAAAIALHSGITANNCVYFSSEAMRRIGYNVPKTIANTRYYVPYLKSIGLRINTNKVFLTSGSICFTINSSQGYPTHTFMFLGWVDPDDHTLAYVIDNQANTVHIRSMINTNIYDAFAFAFHS